MNEGQIIVTIGLLIFMNEEIIKMVTGLKYSNRISGTMKFTAAFVIILGILWLPINRAFHFLNELLL